MLFKKTTINGTILLQNKPDAGTALGHCVALGILAIFGLPFILFMLEDNYFTINDLLPILVLFTPIFWFFIVLLIEIYWGFLGIEIVYYSDTVLYIQQKQSFRRDVVIPWSSISHIEPYDEPILYFGLPTHDPTICLHYKTEKGKTRKVRFGYHLSPRQRESIIERIKELCVQKFPSDGL
jgi:hypothetical protein